MGVLSHAAAAIASAASALSAALAHRNIRYRDPGAKPMPRNHLRRARPSSGKARLTGHLGAAKRQRAQEKRERRRARNLHLIDCGGFRT
jgi:hypothetical protein